MAFANWKNDQAQKLAQYSVTYGPNGEPHVNVPVKINVALNVTVTDHGKYIGGVYQAHDLLTNNFYAFLTAFFTNAGSGGSVTWSLKDTSNTARTGTAWGGSGSSSCCTSHDFGFIAPLGGGGQFEVGTGSVAPTRADYQLGGPYQSFFTAITTACAATSSSSSFTMTGSENAQTGATITEAGAFLNAGPSGGTAYNFLMARDTFAGVSVSTGNTITVQDTFTLNSAGLNRNFCTMLATLFSNVNFGTSQGFGGASTNIRAPIPLSTFFATIGANVTYTTDCGDAGGGAGHFQGIFTPLASASPSASSCNWWTDGTGADTQNILYVAVGTGTSAFTPSSNSLNAFSHSSVITQVTYDNAGDLYITATNVLSVQTTVAEAAIYLTLAKGCEGYSPHASSNAGSCTGGFVTLTTMWAAVTFTGVVVNAGTGIGVTFEFSG